MFVGCCYLYNLYVYSNGYIQYVYAISYLYIQFVLLFIFIWGSPSDTSDLNLSWLSPVVIYQISSSRLSFIFLKKIISTLILRQICLYHGFNRGQVHQKRQAPPRSIQLENHRKFYQKSQGIPAADIVFHNYCQHIYFIN